MILWNESAADPIVSALDLECLGFDETIPCLVVETEKPKSTGGREDEETGQVSVSGAIVAMVVCLHHGVLDGKFPV
mgnify:CR=1 FL=1